MKLIMTYIIASSNLQFANNSLMLWFWTHPQAKLFMVMVATPAVMNSLQYLAVDYFIEDERPGKDFGEEEEDSGNDLSTHFIPSERRPPAFADTEPASGFLDSAHLMPKEKYSAYLSFCEKSLPNFREYYGLDQLSADERDELFDYIQREGKGGIELEVLKDALATQRKLVDVFNKYLDLGRE